MGKNKGTSGAVWISVLLYGQNLSFCMDKTDVPVIKAILITIQTFEVGKWCLLTVMSSYHFLVSVTALDALGRALSLLKA